MRRTLLAVLLALPALEGAGQPEVELAAIVAFNEGPTADAEGNVYFTETRSHRIMKYAPDGSITTFRDGTNAANGLIFDEQWRLIACEGSTPELNNPRVTRMDLRTGKIEVLAESYEGKRFNAPNDVSLDSQGRIYFTDPIFTQALPGRTGVNAVYRIDPDGSVHRILAQPEIQRPNGITVAADDKTLYLVEANSTEGGARMIRAYDLQPDGTVKNMRVHYNFYPGRSADGMTIDAKGNLYAAAGLHRRRGTSETLDTKPGIHVISPEGKLLQYIPIPEDTITNCAFGGQDLKTLYVTAGKSLFRVRVEETGTRR